MNFGKAKWIFPLIAIIFFFGCDKPSVPQDQILTDFASDKFKCNVQAQYKIDRSDIDKFEIKENKFKTKTQILEYKADVKFKFSQSVPEITIVYRNNDAHLEYDGFKIDNDDNLCEQLKHDNQAEVFQYTLKIAQYAYYRQYHRFIDSLQALQQVATFRVPSSVEVVFDEATVDKFSLHTYSSLGTDRKFPMTELLSNNKIVYR